MGECITISIVSIIPTLSSCFLGIYQEMCVLFLVYDLLLLSPLTKPAFLWAAYFCNLFAANYNILLNVENLLLHSIILP